MSATKNPFTCPFSGKTWTAAERNAVDAYVKKAIARCEIEKPTKCNRCGKETGRIDPHNHSYDHPTKYIEPMCQGCHTGMHRRYNINKATELDKKMWENSLSNITSKTQYENEQIIEIDKWKSDPPTVISKAVGFIAKPVTWIVNSVIPNGAIEGALNLSSSAAAFLTDTQDILRDSGVSSIKELRTHNLEKSDKLANEVHNWAIGIATSEGGVTGYCGLPGIAVDIPSIIVIALRTIHKIGICYGFEPETEQDRKYILGILAASGANEMKDKVVALTTLRTIEVTIMKQTWKSMAQKAATNQLSKEAGIIAIKNLAKELGVNLTKRKALQAIPGIGAVVGASVNGWYIKEVGWAARRKFQERWLIENGKLVDV